MIFKAKGKIQYKSIFISGYKELAHKDDEQAEQADVRVIASTEDTDRDMEIIKQDGLDLTQFIKNPVILFAHNYQAPPIGKAIKAEITERGLQIDIKFASEKANPLAQQVKQLMKEGILKAVSIGFIPKERDANDPKIITSAEILELSIVPVPSNPNALALAVEKGFAKELFRPLKKKKKAGHTDDKPKKPKGEHIPQCDVDDPLFDADKCAELTAAQEERDGKDTKLAHGRVEQAIEQVTAAPDFEGKEDILKLLNEVMEMLPSTEDDEKAKQEATETQTLILSKSRFETVEEARNWIRDNDFKDEKLDETDESWRFRQFPPGDCQDDSFRTIELTEGVSAVICRPKEGKSMCSILEIDISSPKKRGTGKKEPSKQGGKEERSEQDAFITVEFSEKELTELRDLRRRTLRSYKRDELILSLTKKLSARNAK